MKSIIVAIKFLTIVPVARRMEVGESDMARSAAAFPLAGLLQGAALLGAAYLSGLALPVWLAAAVALIVHVAVGGAFHLDGLSDTFDAIAKRGDADAKLRAMKDSSSGAVGVAAVVLSVLLKYLLIVTALGIHPVTIYALLMAPVFSKWAMSAAILHGKSARAEGLGRIFIEGSGPREFVLSTLTAFALMTLAAVYLAPLVPHKHLLNAASLLVVYLFTLIMSKFFEGQFGGHTGDTLGAVGELSENVFLLGVAVWSGLFIS